MPYGVPSLALEAIEVRSFRNLHRVSLSLGPGVNVFAGDNGQGKTNLVEAMYALCTSRSFRTNDIVETIEHGAEAAAVSGTFTSGDDLPRTQSIGLSRGARKLEVGSKLVRSLAAYAAASPVVVFEPRSLTLTQGGAGERRRLLDRVGFHVAVESEGSAKGALDDQARYRQAHVRRRKALARRDDPRVLDALEALMALHGERIAQRRNHTVARLSPRVVAAFAAIARLEAALSVELVRRGPADQEGIARTLHDRRDDDTRRGTATVGPHLDDLDLRLDGRPFRGLASQGQHRMLVLAIASAELETIADAREVSPILLLDDVSSELDPTRNAALFGFLHGRGGQVMVTTVRPETLPFVENRRDFRVSRGVVES